MILWRMLSLSDGISLEIVPEYEWASDATIRQIIDGLIGDIAWDTPVGTLSRSAPPSGLGASFGCRC